tara:strand:- start:656 stop:874 length:219 start_codon:yes stop_codon:yes gene_type:complete
MCRYFITECTFGDFAILRSAGKLASLDRRLIGMTMDVAMAVAVAGAVVLFSFEVLNIIVNSSLLHERKRTAS